MILTEDILKTIICHYPGTQAIYLFGTYGIGNAWPDSDVDIALLLPPETSKRVGPLMWSQLQVDIIKSRKLGLPQNSAEAFDLMHRANLIPIDMMKNMKGMVGFRNVLVQEYQQMSLSIICMSPWILPILQ